MSPMFLTILISFAWSMVQADYLDSSVVPDIEQKVDVADAVNEFGYKLTLTMMEQANDENIVISPTSVAGLLAITLLGSIGKTHEELAAALGFSQDIIESRRNHEQFGELLQSLNSNESSSKTLYADALFVDIQSRIRDLYRDYLQRVYNGDALSVDFTRAVEVKDMINNWVDSHTEGKIQNFLQKTLPVTTKAVLLSALYFSGQWEKPFLQTRKMNFTKPSNATVIGDMMLNGGFFRYKFSQEDDFHIIALPYNDSTTTLYALQPHGPLRRRPTLHDLMTRLNFSKINQVIETMEDEQCVIRFPKMELKIEAKLAEHLKALGVQSMFTPGQANFALMIDSNMITNTTDEILSRITGDGDGKVVGDGRGIKEILGELPNPGVYVDTVLHRVKLTINEYGTEAVAATSAMIARSAKLFLIDSPFYMFIRNERTRLITFSAIINDPTA